jgi:membrane associated rhomboid family serine protease
VLIIPIQKKPDWRNPPLVCFALIALNFLIFLLYQGQDESRWQTAEEFYFASELPAREESRFYQFVDERHPEWRLQAEAEGEDFVYQQLLWDQEFHHWLLPQLHAEGEQQWLDERARFVELRNRLSSYALGLTPAQPTLAGLFGHMFLHGGWDHLLGNMVFLLLFGLSVELALGAARFVALYLLGGLAAAGLHMAVEAGSLVPVIGASGAVSAVMGMFVAVYGIRRLRFFYSLGFVFGEFTAPALVVLPLWLGKEVFGYFYGDSNIAYWAHFGGLAAGFALTALLIRLRPRATVAQMAEQMQAEESCTPEQRLLSRIESLQNQGKLLEAGAEAVAALRQFPQSLPLIQIAIALTAIAPQSEGYQRANLALFTLAKNPAVDTRPLSAGYHDYLEICTRANTQPRALSAQLCLLLAQTAAQAKDWPWLEDLLRRLQHKGVQHALLPRLGMLLVNHYRRIGEEQRAREAMQLIQKSETA